MTKAPQRPLAEVARRWETPFERDAVTLESLSYDRLDNRLTLVLSRHVDELEFIVRFRAAAHFRVMDEIGWSGETFHPEIASLYEDPIDRSRPLTTLQVSASGLQHNAWPDIVFYSRSAADWVYVIFTGWDCVEIIASEPPEISAIGVVRPGA